MPPSVVAAIARSALCPQPPQSYTLLEIGRSHSELLSFENGAPASLRILPWGDETISRAIEETPGVGHDEPEKLKHRSIDEMEGDLGGKADRAVGAGLEALAGCLDPRGLGQTLYLSGDSVRKKEFASRLSKILGDGVRCEILDVPEQSLSSAIAGLKKTNEAGSTRPPLVLQLDETKNGERMAHPAPVKWAALAAALAVILLFLPYAEALLLKPRLAKKLAEVHAQTNRLATIERELNFLQDLKKAQSPYLDTVYLVANSTPPGTRFDTFAMNRRGEVSLKGNMQNAQQVTDFRAKLIASGFFSSVVVDEQAPGADRQKLAVRITAQWKPAAARKPITIDPDPAKTEKPKTGEKENKSNAPPATTPAPPTNTVLPALETKK